MTNNEFNNEISGDVGRLTQIGTVNGNVYVVSNDEALRAVKKVAPGKVAQEITAYIHVIVRVPRVERRVELRVPHELNFAELASTAVEALNLPLSKRDGDTGVQFTFRYSVSAGTVEWPPNTTLKNAKVGDGAELDLVVDVEHDANRPTRSDWGPAFESKGMGDHFAHMIGGGGIFGHDRAEEVIGEFLRHASAGPSSDEIEAAIGGFFKYIDEVPAS